jgi:acyl-CoA synthetase (AMP-forming)/AMP-acid ligase II
VLLRPAAIMMRGWLQSAYELYERPGVTLPAWKSFAPLAVGESYPASLPMPTAIVNHGAATLEAIRKSEAELARQRALATALEEEESAETARLQQWHAREATLALAEEACRKELAQRRTELEKQAAQTSLALKTARLKGMDARAERLRLAVEAREREHASTMSTLQEQIESAEATAESIQNGWLNTGDIARIDEDGWVFIVDRAKDMVIRGGENVYCSEVEAAIYHHEAVVEAIVFGVPDDRLGEEVAAVIVPKPGLEITAGEIQTFLRENLAAYRVPSKIWFRHEPIPRNASGKFLKREVRKEILEG